LISEPSFSGFENSQTKNDIKIKNPEIFRHSGFQVHLCLPAACLAADRINPPQAGKPQQPGKILQKRAQ